MSIPNPVNPAILALKNSLASQKLLTQTFSSDTTSPTITLIISLYNKVPKLCYINYMQGFKELVAWLTNKNTIPIDYELSIYPGQLDPSWKVPPLLYNYTIQEMAQILTPRYSYSDITSYINELRRVEKAIILACISV